MESHQQPDDKTGVTPIFKVLALKNESKTREAGRPIFDDMEVVEVRFAGSNSVSVFPATSFSHWEVNPESGEQEKVTYAERWARQYQQFKRREVQTKSGTPIDYAPFLTEAKKAEMKAMAVYTIEALAAIDGQELKNLGQGGRELKNAAIDYIEKSSSEAIIGKQKAEIDDLKAKLQVAEDDRKYKKRAKPARAVAIDAADDEYDPPKIPADDDDDTESEDGDDESEEETPQPSESEPDLAASRFDDMADVELKRYITAKSGKRPHGNPSHRTLVTMAELVTRR